MLKVVRKVFDQPASHSSWQRFCLLSREEICLTDLSIGIYHLSGSVKVLRPFQPGKTAVAVNFQVENDRFGVYECQLTAFDEDKFVLMTFIFGHQNVYEFRVFDVRRNIVTDAGSFVAEPQVRLLPNFMPILHQNPTDNRYEVAILQQGNQHQLALRNLLNRQTRFVDLPVDFGNFLYGTELLLYANSQVVSIDRHLTAARLGGSGEIQQIEGSPDGTSDLRLYQLISDQLFMFSWGRIGPHWCQLQLWRLEMTRWRWDKQFQTQLGSNRRVVDFCFSPQSQILTVLLSSDFERNCRLTLSCWWLTVPRLSDLCRLTIESTTK